MTRTTRRTPPQRPRQPTPAGPVDVSALADMVGYRLRRATAAVYLDFIATFRATNIRPTQFSVLTVIGANPGRTQSAIAQALHLKRANFVVLLDELEVQGLIWRAPSMGDRRSYALHLTDKGQAALKMFRRLNRRHESHIARRLGAAGRRQLLELLDRLSV
ncbi:MAG: MarR family transcriptional regulator [Rhodospirillales bacterium]|nr:MarR family transcriptional regulator [Rhodospirillales bacterium]